MKINTTTSIFNSIRKAVENDVKETIQDAENLIKGGVEHVEAEIKSGEQHVVATIEKDTSRVIAALHVTAVAAGTDITVTLDHAAGEVKRLVISGTTTVEGLIAKLRSLATKV